MVVSIFFFFFSSRRRHTRCALVTGVQTCALPIYFPASATLVRYYVALVGVHCIGQRAAGTEPARLDFRSEERRVGKEVSVRVDLGGRRIIKKKITKTNKYRHYKNKRKCQDRKKLTH